MPFRGAKARTELRRLLRNMRLHTVCESADCPNLFECWSRKTATFMLLGDLCTRNCRFCAISQGAPAPPDADEPERVARAAQKLALRYVVITSVTRDDLPDGGAAHFAATVRAVRQRLPGSGIEVLTPDFGGREASVAAVMNAAPTVFNHNVETCARLSALVRPEADYHRSLTVLTAAAHMADRGTTRVKSGLMLGMGEQTPEVHAVLSDLRDCGVDILTLGQYLPPSPTHWPLDRYPAPEEFAEWARVARAQYAFARVISAPLVRSSYLADTASMAPDPGETA